jgi:hypothetical protein
VSFVASFTMEHAGFAATLDQTNNDTLLRAA